MKDALLQSNLPLPVRRGKVRDVYDLGDSLLIVATDRISAYDVVMPNARQVTLWGDFSSSNTDTSGGVPLSPSSCGRPSGKRSATDPV